jgi:CBS domain-containing protein
VVTARDIEQRNGAAASLRDLIGDSATFPYVHPDHPLSLALERMGYAAVDTIPVVSRANLRQVCGIVTLADVLAAYGVHRDGAPGEMKKDGDHAA